MKKIISLESNISKHTNALGMKPIVKQDMKAQQPVNITDSPKK